MKKRSLFLLTVLCCLPLLADQPAVAPAPPAPPARDADPALIQAYNMEILEAQAKIWEDIAGKTNDPANRDLYYQLAASYRLLKEYRQELFLNELNQQPFHYEKLGGQHHQHNKLLEAAILIYGEKNAPVIPPDVHPKRAPAPVADPPPVPQSTYTTESGFEVKLKLEN